MKIKGNNVNDPKFYIVLSFMKLNTYGFNLFKRVATHSCQPRLV